MLTSKKISHLCFIFKKKLVNMTSYTYCIMLVNNNKYKFVYNISHMLTIKENLVYIL